MPDFEPGIDRRLHQLDPNYLRKTAVYRICVIWIVPLLYAVINASVWTCTDHCICPISHQAVRLSYENNDNESIFSKAPVYDSNSVPNAYSAFEVRNNITNMMTAVSYLQNKICRNKFNATAEPMIRTQPNCPKTCGCSRYWEPMKDRSMIILFGVWCVCCIFLFIILIRAYIIWPKRKRPRRSKMVTASGTVERLESDNSSQKKVNRQISTRSFTSVNYPTDKKFWFLVLLYVVLMVTSGPVIILMFIDSSLQQTVVIPVTLRNTFFVLPVMYTMLSTILLLNHIPTLRSTARGLLFCQWVGQ